MFVTPTSTTGCPRAFESPQIGHQPPVKGHRNHVGEEQNPHHDRGQKADKVRLPLRHSVDVRDLLDAVRVAAARLLLCEAV